MGLLMPMNIFLRQELDRMQRVIIIVRSTLTDLRLAIDGTIIMSENLRDALDNIYDARVPTLWGKVKHKNIFGFIFLEFCHLCIRFIYTILIILIIPGSIFLECNLFRFLGTQRH